MIRYHPDIIQGSEEWAALRCGTLTASGIGKLLTPTLKPASNDASRTYLCDMIAQRVTRYVEPQFVSDDMLRGTMDEITARDIYSEHHAPVEQTGFVTNDRWGFTIGYSPDGLVGDDGLIECKSRRYKYQVATILAREMPADYLIQCQTGLLVTDREWLDFCSYAGGLPMFVTRIYPDAKVQDAIVSAASLFEEQLAEKMALFLRNSAGMIPTERMIEVEMYA